MGYGGRRAGLACLAASRPGFWGPVADTAGVGRDLGPARGGGVDDGVLRRGAVRIDCGAHAVRGAVGGRARMGGPHDAAGRALGAGAGRTYGAPLSASVEGRLGGAVPERMPWRKR